MITIQTRPQLSSDTTPTRFSSKWNAGHNPIVYNMRREDYQIVSITDNGFGKMRVTLTGVFVPPLGQIYIKSGGVYDGIYPFQGYGNGVGQTFIAIDSPFISNTFGGYLNFTEGFKNYYALVTVKAFRNGSFFDVDTMRFTSFKDGSFRVNIYRAVQSVFKTLNENKYISNLYFDENATARFAITVQDFWFVTPVNLDVGFPVTGTLVNDTGQLYYATNSVRQIGQAYGSNLVEYVPYNVDVVPKARFISDFKQPVYFQGFPFDIGFLYSEFLQGTSLTLEQDKINKFGGVIGHVNDQLVTAEESAPQPVEARVMLRGSYPDPTEFVDIWLEFGGIEQMRYVEAGYRDDGYTEVIPPAPVDIDPFACTEKRRIEYRTKCVDNPVYICWRGYEGAWNYWLFSFDQENVINSKSLGTYEQATVENIQNVQSKIKQIQRQSTPSIIMGANGLNLINVDGAKSIYDSPEILMLTSLNPVKWVTVNLASKKFSYKSRYSKFDWEIELELPYKNTIQQ